jgi:hypothetical protein
MKIGEKKAKIYLWACIALAAVSVCCLAACFLLPARAEAAVSWKRYNSQTDSLFWALSQRSKTEPETVTVTGVEGIPWADGENDVYEGKSTKPMKRVLHVLLDDSAVDAFVVTYYAPDIQSSGFGGVFRQYPSDGSRRMLSSSTTYETGMLITTFVFAKDENNIDPNEIVTKELALTADIQNILDEST